MATQIEASTEILEYVRAVSSREDDILRELREETSALPGGGAMQVLAEEGQLLGLLARLTGAREVLEIGTFTGYSTLCLARALPPGGRVVTLDITDRWPNFGAAYWRRAGVDDRIELRVGPAVDTLAGLLAERGPGTVDLVFIDADKASYVRYYEAALALVRPGGLILVDNTLFFGRVLDPAAQDPDTVAIRELNELLRDDERVDISLLPVADGLTLARKRD
ncbi:O-methyltransferase [Crossiella sp. CA198]|uniref:O-methyltransferase n=1 Tax=Crossiella sp. CA198 TaxID=3455607 RepID=UPI003F8D4E54